MDEYTRLKIKIESYLDKPDVEMSENEISMYDLHQIVDSRLAELRSIQVDPKLKDEINKNLIGKKIRKIFKKNKSSAGKICSCIMSSCDSQKSVITFGFEHSSSTIKNYFLKVYKDIDSDQIYFGEFYTDKEFVEEYYDQISEYFRILEEFNSLYQSRVGTSGQGAKQVFSDGFLDVSFSYDTLGRTCVLTTLNPKVDPEKIYLREWLKRKTLSDYIKENEETILRKIPININELNYTTKTIVEEHLSKINAPQKKIGGK